MATNYFRVTAYHPTEDMSVIFDTNGMYDKLWQLSSFLMTKGFQILEVSSDEKFLDGNISKAEPCKSLIVRANHAGKPEYTTYSHNGTTYHAVKVEHRTYIPDRDKKAA